MAGGKPCLSGAKEEEEEEEDMRKLQQASESSTEESRSGKMSLFLASALGGTSALK